MLAFLRHLKLEVLRVLPGLDLLMDRGDEKLRLLITAGLPETASRATIERFKALIKEAWSTADGGRPVRADIDVATVREPFAAVLAVQHSYASRVPPPLPGSSMVGWGAGRGGAGQGGAER